MSYIEMNVIVFTTRGTTWMLTVSDADMLSVGQVPVTVTGTVPGVFGAVHTVFCCAGFANVPVGALH